LNPLCIADHLQVDRYGDFLLTEAIRPGPRLPVIPREAFRVETYRDAALRIAVPVLAAAVSRDKLFDVFLDLVGLLGPVVDVVLETSHDGDGTSHRDLLREQIDLPVLLSHFCEFEDLLLNDGCTGTAIIGSAGPMEVQFDEHKLLVVYARDLEPFERVLWQAGIERDDTMKLITEGEHLHSSAPEYHEEFWRLCHRVGVGEAAERVNW